MQKMQKSKKPKLQNCKKAKIQKIKNEKIGSLNIYWEIYIGNAKDQLKQIDKIETHHISILWQPPLLAQPGPANEAIHWALLSLLISSSILIATALLAAASFAAGVINPTLANKHIACALTAVRESKRRYCPTIKPSWCSDSWRPVARVRWATLASAQVWIKWCKSLLPSPHWPTT